MGHTSIEVHGKIFAGIAIHSSAEPGSLMVRLAPEDRDELISAAPEVYYVTDHYVQGNGVLVRLSRVNADVLRERRNFKRGLWGSLLRSRAA